MESQHDFGLESILPGLLGPPDNENSIKYWKKTVLVLKTGVQRIVKQVKHE
jgi:hypothetical protein